MSRFTVRHLPVAKISIYRRYLPRSGDGAHAYYISYIAHIYHYPPSSGASERVFALLKNMFGEDQLNALADYIEVALMLRYNIRKVG